MHPIGFWSRKLHAAELNNSATEREALDIVWHLQLLRPYLQGHSFDVESDHRACQALFRQVSPNRRLMKWRLQLSNFTFKVRYKPGSENTAADPMSRLETEGVDNNSWDLDLPTLLVDFECVIAIDTAALVPIQLSEMRHEQSRDGDCQDALERGRMHGHLVIEDDERLIVRLVERRGMPTLHQIVVPETLRERVMKLSHQPQASAHPGHARMYWSLRSQFVWIGMSNGVTRVLNECPTCCQARLKRQGRTRKLKLIPPTCALEQVAIDILGSLPVTSRGHRYVLVMTDRFSKLTRAIPLKGITAAEVALAFVEVWVASYGVPSFLLSDNGSQFVSKLFQRVAQLLGITQLFTSPYYPSCNGQVERFNSTILDKLRRYVNEDQSDWDDSVAAITLAYNETPHSSTGFRLFELVVPEADKRQPLRREVGLSKLGDCGNTSEYHKALLLRVQEIAWMTKETLRESQLSHKKAHDAHIPEQNRDIRVGDWVFIN
jgi:hypothetical protein